MILKMRHDQGPEAVQALLDQVQKARDGFVEKGLDAGTAFEILSIDIADVDVGSNVGAKLQADQAEADTRVARALAEQRRAEAVALGQEMKARVEEMQAKVVEAEAQVPLAMAQAFRSGNLGVMDFYRLRNIESDTKMRTQIAQGEEIRGDGGDPRGQDDGPVGGQIRGTSEPGIELEETTLGGSGRAVRGRPSQAAGRRDGQRRGTVRADRPPEDGGRVVEKKICRARLRRSDDGSIRTMPV